MLPMKLRFYISNLLTHVLIECILKAKKELNHDGFIDPNVRGAKSNFAQHIYSGARHRYSNEVTEGAN